VYCYLKRKHSPICAHILRIPTLYVTHKLTHENSTVEPLRFIFLFYIFPVIYTYYYYYYYYHHHHHHYHHHYYIFIFIEKNLLDYSNTSHSP